MITPQQSESQVRYGDICHYSMFMNSTLSVYSRILSGILSRGITNTSQFCEILPHLLYPAGSSVKGPR